MRIEEWDERVYREVFELHRERLQQEAAQLSMPPPFPNLDVDALSDFEPVAVAQHWQRQHNEYIKMLSDTEALEEQISLLENQIAASSDPPGLRSGFAVLTAFAVVGILFPLALMANGPTDLHVGWRIAVLGGFSLGLAAVVTYLVRLAREATSEVP